MSARLTADNATKETLEETALETAGLLGTYQREEFEALQALDREDWSFEWLPFKMDDNVGRVKMKPLTPKSTKALDKGRAYRLMRRHPKMQLSFAVSFIKTTKRSRFGLNARVQDFLLEHWRSPEVPELLSDRQRFDVWVRKHSVHRLTGQQLDTIWELMPKVLKTMPKARSKKPRQK